MRIRPSSETLWQQTAIPLPKYLQQELLLRDLNLAVRIREWHESRCAAKSLAQPPRPLPVSELCFRPFLAELSGVPIRRTGQVSPLFPRDMAQQREWDIKACHSVVFGANGTRGASQILPKILSYYLLSHSLCVSEGILARFSLSSLVAPNYLGEPPGVANGR